MLPMKTIHIFKRFNHKWLKPDGYDTGIKVYNCVTKEKVPLIIKNKNLVTWYTCGPTVYDSSHVGHASCFLKLDIIQRILRNYFNLNLVTVMNITDIDDKIIARSNASNIPVKDLTKQYEKEFWNDIEALNIIKPNYIMRVSDNIEIIKKFIGKLVETGKAYVSDNKTVYFDVTAYTNYGKLVNVGTEVEVKNKHKKNNMDFALWKAAKPGEIYWESPWGQGRPGWHIECSAMASHIFGSQIDIHAGGIDLKFPHHENEEAQSCALHNKNQWVNYWLHTGHLHLKNDIKMSKSLKNTIPVESLLKTNSPNAFRMACFMTHYRKSMEFSPELLTTAENNLKTYVNFIDNVQNYLKHIIKANVNSDVVSQLLQNSADGIHEALIDDFNTPAVANILYKAVSTVNGLLHSSATDLDDSKSVEVLGVLNLVLNTLEMVGLTINKVQSSAKDNNFDEIINILNNFRQEIRQIGISTKDKHLLQLCDTVRSSVNKCGITIKDHDKLSSWS